MYLLRCILCLHCFGMSSCHVLPCHVMPCHVMLCIVGLYFAMLCYVTTPDSLGLGSPSETWGAGEHESQYGYIQRREECHNTPTVVPSFAIHSYQYPYWDQQVQRRHTCSGRRAPCVGLLPFGPGAKSWT